MHDSIIKVGDVYLNVSWHYCLDTKKTIITSLKLGCCDLGNWYFKYSDFGRDVDKAVQEKYLDLKMEELEREKNENRI